MIGHDNMPLCSPEKEGLILFAKSLNPHYKPPCEQTLTKMLHEKYQELKLKVSQLLKSQNKIVLTTDIWTETMTVKSYIGITVHFLEGTAISSFSLGARCIAGTRKTKENLVQVLDDICKSWDIDKNKVLAVITDKGANIVAACKEYFGESKHLYCFAHLTNLVATDTIGLYDRKKVETRNSSSEAQPSETSHSNSNDDDCSENENEELDEEILLPGDLPVILRKLKKIVTFCRRCEAASSELEALQMKERNKTRSECLKLIQEIRTRWNSLYEMIERYLDLSEFVDRALMKVSHDKSSKSKVPSTLTIEERETLETVKDLLEPLWQMTKEICSEKNVTLSKVIPIIRMVRLKANSYVNGDPVAFNMQTRLISELSKRFGAIESSLICSVATLLDPRFKNIHFENGAALAKALTYLGNLVRLRSNAEEDRAQAQRAPIPTADDRSLWAVHDNIVAAQRNQDPDRNPTEMPDELRLYLRRACCSRLVNPLEEWERLKRDFPNLYELAREFLLILATSVPSERLFSKAGILVTKLRNRLSGEHIEMILFMRSVDFKLWFD